ncbi:MAG: sigma-70 family RNA polymerase sigma factor [Candidatus Dormiibacterota bacterium]
MTELPPVARLVHLARGGDARAFGELVERFQPMAQGYALALLRDTGLAEDACQEAFVDAFLHLHQLRADAAFPAWFRRVVRKHADRQRRSRLLAVELGDLPGTNDPLAALLEAEERRVVQNEVAALPARLRSSIELFYGSGLSVDEIAGFLNVAPSAIKKRLFDARARLRRTLPTPVAAGSSPRDAIALFIASRIGDARISADILARRPDLASLTERWADPDEVRDYGAIGAGYTLVQRAVFMGHRAVVEVLVRAGAPLHARVGLDPLDLAVLQDDLDMARLLLAVGAPPSGTREGTLTPLHRAAIRGLDEMARLLLESGASRDATGPGGRKAADWARLKGHTQLAGLIEEYRT